MDVGENFIERGAEAPAFVECRDDDAVSGIQGEEG
jgi:hypothetical protein